MAQQIMGNRILGGIGAPDSRAGASFGAGVDTALNQRTSRQQMQEREQMMGLRASQEQRAQQQFELQQRQAAAARAQAAATTAQRRAMMDSIFNAGAAAPAAVASPAAGVRAPVNRQLVDTLRSGTGGSPLAAPAQRSILVPGLAFPAAPGAVTGGAGSPRVAGGAGTDMLAAAGADPRGQMQLPGVPGVTSPLAPRTAAPQRSFMTPESMATRAGLAGMPAGLRPSMGAATANPVQVEMQNAAIQREVAQIDATIESISSALTADGSRSDPSRTIQRINDLRQQRESLVSQLQGTTYPPELPGIFAEEGPGAAGLPPQVLATGEAPPPEPLGTAEEFPSAVRQGAPGAAGVQTPSATPVQQAAAETDGAPSERYINNADLIQMDRDRLAQQVAREQQLLQYLVSTGDVGGYQQGQAIVAAQGQLAKLEIEQRYLDGMVAITAIENGNFGPLQTLLQQRPEFQGRQVSVVPYTDGTVEIYVDGQPEEEMSWGDLVENLKFVYDQGYQTFLGEQADTLAEMRMKDFENRSAQAAQAEREIAVAVTEDALKRAAEEGELQSVVDANGIPTLQMRINGAWTGVYIEQVQEQVPGGEPSVRLILRRVDTGEAVPLTGE